MTFAQDSGRTLHGALMTQRVCFQKGWIFTNVSLTCSANAILMNLGRVCRSIDVYSMHLLNRDFNVMKSVCLSICRCHSSTNLPSQFRPTNTYSCGRVIIDTWSAGVYQIKLGCAWYYPTAHTHVSSVACVWAIQKQSYCSRTTRRQSRIALLAQHNYISLNMHWNSPQCQW